ncbi:ABC transporter substrate-binding protein [Nonomuraea typhae]|uniref:ABC transporter substrate-binding protein n=1 Tax=Nonomuraea typhae TaxID=2603600 RepID=UPI0012FAF255|nr:ABC transporter substrate-binding protein [Nonomuraea typhae]
MASGITRRQALRGGSFLALGALAAACGTAGPGGPAAAPATSPAGTAGTPAGPWTFTDDRGKQVTAPKPPRRIVAYVGAAAALQDFGVPPVGLFGSTTLKDGSKDPLAGDVDLAKATSIGTGYGEFNVEKYASLQPELLVTTKFNDLVWYVPEKQMGDIEALAPLVAIETVKDTDLKKVLARFEALAVSLGADVSAPAVAQAKAAFDAASAKVAQTAKKGLKVLAVAGGPDQFWVARAGAGGYTDLTYLASLGLGLEKGAGDDPLYETLSWEQAGKYKADVILYDARSQWLTLADMKKKATFAEMPAVKAGQVIPWAVETPYSYQRQAAWLDKLDGQLSGFKPL